jgi:D-alanyl-D-alanine carboxypeptidase/D-alanyl-D-alanine-endopeptidase (penicillin-binding protein 4)
MRDVLERWGVRTGDLVLADGSGLSRYNLITPEALVTILMHVGRDDRLREPFEASLPIAGRDGTLSDRLRGTPAEGNLRAKTGSFTNARSISGYVRTVDGEPLVFAIVANNYGISAAMVDEVTDGILARLASFRRGR